MIISIWCWHFSCLLQIRLTLRIITNYQRNNLRLDRLAKTIYSIRFFHISCGIKQTHSKHSPSTLIGALKEKHICVFRRCSIPSIQPVVSFWFSWCIWSWWNFNRVCWLREKLFKSSCIVYIPLSYFWVIFSCFGVKFFLCCSICCNSCFIIIDIFVCVRQWKVSFLLFGCWILRVNNRMHKWILNVIKFSFVILFSVDQVSSFKVWLSWINPISCWLSCDSWVVFDVVQIISWWKHVKRSFLIYQKCWSVFFWFYYPRTFFFCREFSSIDGPHWVWLELIYSCTCFSCSICILLVTKFSISFAYWSSWYIKQIIANSFTLSEAFCFTRRKICDSLSSWPINTWPIVCWVTSAHAVFAKFVFHWKITVVTFDTYRVFGKSICIPNSSIATNFLFLPAVD